MKDCQICEKILGWFREAADVERTLQDLDEKEARVKSWEHYNTHNQSPIDAFVIRLGSLEEALSSPCRDHTALIRHLKQHILDARTNPRGTDVKTMDNIGFWWCSTDQELVVAHSISRKNIADALLSLHYSFIRGSHVTSYGSSVRLLDPRWIDLGMIKNWIGECSASHSETCENPMKLMPTVPGLLVDVKQRCVVTGTEGLRYVALSYRLGGSAPFKLNEQTLEDFRRDWVLKDQRVLATLPLTVCHAMSLVEAIGERYLWVDVLCIMHGEHSALAGELDKMAAIYTHASFTIVAADGDGLHGLPGLLGISDPRDPPQEVFPIQGERLIAYSSEDHHPTMYKAAEYHTRGWTYQEYLMSPRRLIFRNRKVYWSCGESFVREMELHPTLDHGGLITRRSTYNRGEDVTEEQVPTWFVHLYELFQLLSKYNERTLTRDEDALPAISGLLAVLSRTYVGGFLYGIPEMYFDLALSWRSSYECDLTRRMPSYDSEGAQNKISGLPSWSWIGWKGSIELKDDTYDAADEIGDYLQDTYPITEWYASDSPEGQRRRRILPTWHIDRENAEDSNRPLPEGWTRLSHSEAFATSEDCDDSDDAGSTEELAPVYQYSGIGGWDKYFHHPFRVPKIDTSTPFTIPEQLPYLHCKTWRAYVWSTCDEHDWECERRAVADGDKIGTLYLHNIAQLGKSASIEPSATGGGVKAHICVVAINRVIIRNWHGDGQQDFITVLWVEWENGIAYRQACGRIKEEAWNVSEPEEFDLVLG
jgi:hypothetical protein